MSDLGPVLAGVRAAVAELVEPGGLIDQLREMLPERGQAPETTTMRPSPGSRPPWDGRVADAYTSIGAWARHAEADLGTYARGTYSRAMAGSDRVTRDCLRLVAIHCEDERVPEAEVRRVARALGTLLRAAQSVPGIDTAPPLAATLRQRCPVCTEGELVAAVDASSDIRCVNEMCGARWARREWPFLLSRLTRGATA